MSDLTTLSEKLRQLAGAEDDLFADGMRLILANGERPPLAAILDAIDDTVLERRLHLEIDGKSIDLIAAGRRLRGIAAADEASGDDMAVIGQSLSREDPEMLSSVGQMLARRCTGARRIALRSLPAEPFGDGGERGVGARRLFELWEAEIAAAEPGAADSASDTAPADDASDGASDATDGSLIVQFLAKCAPASQASLYFVDDEIVTETGAKAAASAALQEIADTQLGAFREAHQRFTAPDAGPLMTCLTGVLADDTAVILVSDAEELALLVSDPGDLGALMDSWRALIG